MAGLRWPGH